MKNMFILSLFISLSISAHAEYRKVLPVARGGTGSATGALALTNATALPLTTGVTGILPEANGGTNRTTIQTPAMTYVANLTSILADQILAYGKMENAATILNMIAQATAFTCIANPTLTLYDCGTSASACASGRTALASVTMTAAGGFAGSVSSSALAAGHYWAVETSAGTCTSLTTIGSFSFK